MALNRVIEATALPVTLDEARSWARLDPDVPDAEVQSLILTAAQMWETATGSVLTPSTWELTLDGFVADQVIVLGTAPVISIEWVHYVNTAGDEVEIDPTNYQLDNRSRPAVLAPARDREWPTDCMSDINTVTIRFVAGQETIEQRQRHWVLAMVASLDRFREAHATQPAMPNKFLDGLLDPYRIPGV
jgi:uncharacterized phiE125 gp8 family phage protein